jgi:hypothetical protein
VVPVGLTCIASEGCGKRVLGDSGPQKGTERFCVAILPLRLPELCCIYKGLLGVGGGSLHDEN